MLYLYNNIYEHSVNDNAPSYYVIQKAHLPNPLQAYIRSLVKFKYDINTLLFHVHNRRRIYYRGY